MPEIGELAKAKDIGKSGKNQYIYLPCSDCGEKRWVVKHNIDRGIQVRCLQCAGLKNSRDNNYRWSGGRNKTYNGYIEAKLEKDSPFYPMAHWNGYVLEHRLVMAKHLGRCLLSSEIVHHLNGIRDDNRLENLEFYSQEAKHALLSRACQNCFTRKQLKIQNQELQDMKKQIRLLRWQIKEQFEQIHNLTAKIMGIES